MDQIGIGNFLKELRKEKGLTQEQLAERLNVSGRTVSRWENGNNMPDISILIELADLYDVDIREIIDGERKSENMNEEMKDTLVKVAEYTNAEKEKLSQELLCDFTAGLICMIGVIVCVFLGDIGKNAENCMVMFSFVAVSATASAVRNILLINGRMSKSANTKLQKTALAAAIPLILLCVLVIFFLTK